MPGHPGGGHTSFSAAGSGLALSPSPARLSPFAAPVSPVPSRRCRPTLSDNVDFNDERSRTGRRGNVPLGGERATTTTARRQGSFNFVPKFSKVVWCGCRSVAQEAGVTGRIRGREFPRPRHKSLTAPPAGVNARGICFGDVCNFAPSGQTSLSLSLCLLRSPQFFCLDSNGSPPSHPYAPPSFGTVHFIFLSPFLWRRARPCDLFCAFFFLFVQIGRLRRGFFIDEGSGW